MLKAKLPKQTNMSKKLEANNGRAATNNKYESTNQHSWMILTGRAGGNSNIYIESNDFFLCK